MLVLLYQTNDEKSLDLKKEETIYILADKDSKLRKNTGKNGLDRLKNECRNVSTTSKMAKDKDDNDDIEYYYRCRKHKLFGYFQTELLKLGMITRDEEEKEGKGGGWMREVEDGER